MPLGGDRALIRFLAAAGPGLLVFFAHALFGEIFGHEPYVDPIAHLSGGAAAAFFFARLPRLAPRQLGTPTPATRGLLAIGLTSLVAIVWELGELASDHFRGTHAHTSIGSTLRDLANGVIGAIAWLLVATVLERRAARRRAAGHRSRMA